MLFWNKPNQQTLSLDEIMESADTLLTTALYETHLSLNAKMAPFGGYLMPIHYEGIIKEHMYARRQAALFDTCHMGEFHIAGSTALCDLENLLSCPVASLPVGQCRYGFLCNEHGGVLDDQIIYRMGETEFFMVVNAATRHGDFQWIAAHVSTDTEFLDLSDETGKIDLQGPDSPVIAAKLFAEPIDGMRYYGFRHNSYRGRKVLVSRTGYTGEIGFEIYCDNDLAALFWNDCMQLGAKPAGLGCRDTLRLEMGLPLYGHELTAEMNAAATGFTRAISHDKRFIGSDRVRDPSQPIMALVGIELHGRRAGRNGDTIVSNDQGEIGFVTSGSFSPSLEKALALGYVRVGNAAPGTPCAIDNGRQQLEGHVVALPFYTKATGRKPLADFLPR
jgi:aminomethyltransferase